MRLRMPLTVGTPHGPFFTECLHEGTDCEKCLVTDLPHICKGHGEAQTRHTHCLPSLMALDTVYCLVDQIQQAELYDKLQASLCYLTSRPG